MVERKWIDMSDREKIRELRKRNFRQSDMLFNNREAFEKINYTCYPLIKEDIYKLRALLASYKSLIKSRIDVVNSRARIKEISAKIENDKKVLKLLEKGRG